MAVCWWKQVMRFAELANHLESLTAEAEALLLEMPPGERSGPYEGSSAWTKQELLGHLVDSAINNQQRLVRALIEEMLVFPNYAQVEMVRLQRYGEANWEWLVAHWRNLNLHVAQVIRNTPPEKLRTLCRIGDSAPIPLEALALDYIAHLEHHLRQLAGGRALQYSGLPWPPPDR